MSSTCPLRLFKTSIRIYRTIMMDKMHIGVGKKALINKPNHRKLAVRALIFLRQGLILVVFISSCGQVMCLGIFMLLQ